TKSSPSCDGKGASRSQRPATGASVPRIQSREQIYLFRFSVINDPQRGLESLTGRRLREAFGVRPARRRFGSASTAARAWQSGSKLRALQTLARPSLPLPETQLAFPLFSSLPGLNP